MVLGALRLLAISLAMAFWGTLISDHGRPPAVWTALGWAVVGLALTAEAGLPLPVRLRWLLDRTRAGLLSAFSAYIGWVIGTAIIYRAVLSVVTFYSSRPGFDLGLALRNLVAMTLVVGGMVLGLWADNTAGTDRRRNAVTMLWMLLPGIAVAAVSFIVGQLVFGTMGLRTAWGWGVLATVLVAEAAVGWLVKFQSPRLAQAWGVTQGTAQKAIGPLAGKVTTPSQLSSVWSKLQGELPAALSGMTITTAIGVAGTLVWLAPLATQVVLSLLLVLGCLAAVAVAIGVAVWYARKH